MTPDGTLAGVVLAGGESTRYGDRNKLLEPFEGRPVVEHVARTLRAVGNAPPVVTVRTADQRAAIGEALEGAVEVRFRFDSLAFEGPLAGIAGALDTVTAPWLVVCAGDMPRLSAGAIDRLAARRDENTDAVVPVRDGIREPLHALYRRSALAEALDAVPADVGARALCFVLSPTEVPVDEEPGHLARSLRNVNTPAELERLETGDCRERTDQ